VLYVLGAEISNMKKEFLKKQKEKLVEERKKLQKQLGSFAEKNKEHKGDWKTVYPKFNVDSLEEKADEVEEYTNLLSIEHTLELELKKVNEALKKMQKEGYGICEKCKKPISKARLEVYPQAKDCKKCRF